MINSMKIIFFIVNDFVNGILVRKLTANVFAACFGRIETAVCRNGINKDNCLLDFCKAKIIVPAKRPLLQMLILLPAFLVGAVIGFRAHTVYTLLACLPNKAQ